VAKKQNTTGEAGGKQHSTGLLHLIVQILMAQAQKSPTAFSVGLFWQITIIRILKLTFCSDVSTNPGINSASFRLLHVSGNCWQYHFSLRISIDSSPNI